VTEPKNELTGLLLDIYYELRNTPIRPKIVGGLGIYLRALNIIERQQQTLFPLAPARATQDIDMILPAGTIIDPVLRKSFTLMLNNLEFNVIEKYAHWQYKRNYYGHEQKLDLHTWIPTDIDKGSFRIIGEKLVATDTKSKLDAHIASEAIGADVLGTELLCKGYRNEGTEYQCTVSISHPLTLVVMKLLAYRDYERKRTAVGTSSEEAERHLIVAQKHAFDIYVLLSTITEDEWEQSKECVSFYKRASAVQEADAVVRETFSTVDSLGILRMRSSSDANRTMHFDMMPSLLFELFEIS
jgi:hypothetical protein